MMKFILPMVLALFAVSCGNDKKKRDVPSTITADSVVSLQFLKQDILDWAPTCVSEGLTYACEGTNDDHVALFSGLLCLSGEEHECDAVAASLDESGRLWRNPLDASRGHSDEYKNSSSRDMAVGFLAYLTATKDGDRAQMFVSYLQNNDYKLCDDDTDGRCYMGPITHYPLWSTLRSVYEYIGLEPTSEMRYVEIGDETLIKWQAEFSPRGFGLHLIASQLLTQQYTDSWTNTLQSAANILYRRAPDNPYFEYLSQGKTESAAQKVFTYCPSESPEDPSRWLWEKDDIAGEAEFTMGHDCVFMINLLTR